MSENQIVQPQGDQPQQINWHSEKRKISDLIPAPYNPRKWPENETKNLAASLDKFNLADPLVINQNNTVIGGHFRLKILRDKGLKEIDVRVPSRLLDEAEEKELNIRLNRNLGLWDFDALANFDEDMLKDIGFDSKELDKIFQLDAMPEDDDVPNTRPTTDIKLGDVFVLGDHRLMCGDSTKREDVEKLMAGEKADMVFTDPPYCLFGNSSGVSNVADDKMVRPFFRDIFKMCREFVKQFGHIYVCCDWHSAFVLQLMAEEQGLTKKNLCVWDKGDGGVGGMYQNCYEFIWFYANSPLKTMTIGSGKSGERTINGKPNIWRHKRENIDRIHNAQKPIEMIANAIQNSCDNSENVLDLFGGSGSTLIACEKLNRKCRMMEIAPVYCQTIIDRFEKFTGKKAGKI